MHEKAHSINFILGPSADRFFVYTDPTTGKLHVIDANQLLKDIAAQLALSEYERQLPITTSQEIVYPPVKKL